MMEQTIPEILEGKGFREIQTQSLRMHDYKEIVEYFNGKVWRIFAK